MSLRAALAIAALITASCSSPPRDSALREASPIPATCAPGSPGCAELDDCREPGCETRPAVSAHAASPSVRPRPAIVPRPRTILRPTTRPAPTALPRPNLRPTPAPAPSSPPSSPRPSRRPTATLLAAGDIADCRQTGDEETALLLDELDGTVVTLGDTVYEHGTPQEFAECYEPNWGRHKDRTRPSIGNHEYGSGSPAGYFGYFGRSAGDPSKGYYSYDLGGWHVVVLNSMCNDAGGCGPEDPQAAWLKADLASTPALCTVAYWHHPLFTSGSQGPSRWMRVYWEILHEAGVDIVLNGHDHHYERFVPMNPSGAADPIRGIRTFIVGTGGKSLLPIHHNDPNSEIRQNDTFGILALELRPGLYSWRFVPTAGRSFTDTGTDRCR